MNMPEDRHQRKVERYMRAVQPHIEHCVNCQPFDEGEPVWIYGDKISLTDLLDDCDIPEEYQEEVASALSCPGCGTQLEIFYDVGLKTKFEKEIEEHHKKAFDVYGKSVTDFIDFIISYPLLAMDHNFGKLIHNEIQSGKFAEVKLEGLVFRSRLVSDSRIFKAMDMLEPPVGKSTEGRFNHSGQSLLYCAKDKETALYETSDKLNPSLVWLQKFEIEGQIENILDLTSDWTMFTTSTSAIQIVLSGVLGRNENNIELYRPDYYVTRFISDCARKMGYAGIKYSSVHTGKANFVLFDTCENLGFHPIGPPTIEKVPCREIGTIGLL